MKANTPTQKSKVPSRLDAAQKRQRALHEQGHFQDALDICLQITRTHPKVAAGWTDAAANCIYLGRWQDAIRYARTALACGANNLRLCDTLAHAHGQLGQWDEARRYGLQALNMRARQVSGEPPIPLPAPGPMPPPPSAQTRERNTIAFSLFGGDSKYCEVAVLNVQEQPHVYPHWVCRFYVDGSVPGSVINRLQAGGAQIVQVDGAAAQWPGPMWRLLALQDPQVDRILFRDADSLISRREASAIGQWLTSGKRFHMMRDIGSATELMMAGLWGVVAGSLPPLEQLMQRFMSAPLESRRFADQFFLRQYVWPYARASLMQHDSAFGFMDAVPFPDGNVSEGSRVGETEGSATLTVKSDQPDGSNATWELYRIIEKIDNHQAHATLICAYPGTVHDGTVKAHIPRRYVRWLEQGLICVRLRANNAA
jgi:hypothetical protein